MIFCVQLQGQTNPLSRRQLARTGIPRKHVLESGLLHCDMATSLIPKDDVYQIKRPAGPIALQQERNVTLHGAIVQIMPHSVQGIELWPWTMTTAEG